MFSFWNLRIFLSLWKVNSLRLYLKWFLHHGHDVIKLFLFKYSFWIRWRTSVFHIIELFLISEGIASFSLLPLFSFNNVSGRSAEKSIWLKQRWYDVKEIANLFHKKLIFSDFESQIVNLLVLPLDLCLVIDLLSNDHLFHLIHSFWHGLHARMILISISKVIVTMNTFLCLLTFLKMLQLFLSHELCFTVLAFDFNICTGFFMQMNVIWIDFGQTVSVSWTFNESVSTLLCMRNHFIIW